MGVSMNTRLFFATGRIYFNIKVFKPFTVQSSPFKVQTLSAIPWKCPNDPWP